MGFRNLIPWSGKQDLAPARDNFDPFLTLHREMNRLFDDVRVADAGAVATVPAAADR